MKRTRNGFIIRESYDFLLSALNDEQLGRLWRNIRQYQNGASVDEINFASGAERVAFCSIKDQIDKDAAKYRAKCIANRKNGLLGGRPHKNPK